MISYQKNNLKKNSLIETKIIDLTFDGKGIGRIKSSEGDLICFVENVIIGQIIIGKIKKIKSNHIVCSLIEVKVKSELEIKNEFNEIPGAPFINLEIKTQKNIKLKRSIEAYKRIGKIHDIEKYFDEYIDSPDVYHYRNKMEYSFSAIKYDKNKKKDVDEFALGFKKRGSWWMVEDLNKDSGLFDEEFENFLPTLKSFFIESGFSPWHAPKKKGFFKYLKIRKSISNNNFIINLITTSKNHELFKFDELIYILKKKFKERFIGFIHSLNDEIGDRTYQSNNKLIYGIDYIEEKILGLNFKISLNSFFQTNTNSAKKLFQKVVEYVYEIKEKKKILDLYCGTGTICQLIAKKFNDSEVIGVEIIDDAIKNAKENTKKNNIKNLKLYNLDIKKFFNSIYLDSVPDLITIDPPRSGIDKKTMLKILDINCKNLIYISCNPATQARDLEILLRNRYQIKKFSLIDQFPHTSHIESILLLIKTS